MGILADTNILLRRTQRDDPNHFAAMRSVAKLLGAGEPVYFTLQNISEFWNVATRPAANNGLGLSVALTLAEVDEIGHFLTLLPEESPAVFAEWKRLVLKYNVLGKKVHDTKLVAAMNIYGIRRILTFNTDDFARYEIDAVHPLSLI